MMLSFRQASAIPIPLPASISTVRRWQMISSSVYRVRAMPPPFVGWNPNSKPDLVYRGQVAARDKRKRLMHPTSRAVPSDGIGHGQDVGRLVHLRRLTGATGIVPVSKGLIALSRMVR
jgi:hypothetical protein